MAARSDILEKVKKSRQEAERRIQESNQKAEAQRKASEQNYQRNTSQETKKAASYMKQYSTPSRAGNSVADYASKRKQATSWYKGSMPTEVETLAKIAQEAEKNYAFGEELYGYYEQAKAEGTWKETYDKATSQYLTALGLTADQVNDELFIQAAPYMNAGIITNAGNQSTSKKNSTAANFAGLYDDYQKTKVLQAEEAEAMKEAQYWIAKGLTDEEIIQKLNIGGEGSKYSNLTKAFNKTKTGEYEPTTAPIQLLTSYGVQGMLYGLRNPNDASGDYKMDAVKAQLGRGVQHTSTPDEIARRTPGSGSWAPYSNGTTMDDEAIRFGVGKEFSTDWLEKNRDAVFASGDQKAISAFGKVYAAEEFTKEAEAEYADLIDNLNRTLSAGGDLDADEIIKKLFYIAGEDKYPSLAELDESLLSGKIIDTTRGIGYDRKSIEQTVRDYVAAQNTLVQATTDPEAMEQVVQDRKKATAAENGGTLLTPGAFIDAVDESVRKSILFDGAISPDTIREGLAWVGNQLSEFSQNRRNRRKEKIEQEKQQKEEETQKKLDMSEQLIGEPDESSALPEPVAVIASEGASDVSSKARTMTAEEYDAAQAEVIALEEEGRYEEAAKKQFPLLVAAVTNSDDEYVKEIVTSVGSQEAALYLTRLIFEGDMLNQLDDDTVWDAVTNYEYYICKVLDIDPASADMFAQVMDFISGDAYSETRDNTGVGFLRAAESTLVQGGAKANDWWATIAGAAMTGYGHAVKGTNWLVNNTLGKLFGFQLNNTAAEATIEAGQNLDTYYEKISAREDAFMRENATPFEYYSASAGSEAIKMGVQSVAGSAITGKVTQGAGSVSQIMRTKDGYRQLQTAIDLAKLEGFTSHIAAATPFIADSAASEYNSTYQETENPVTALVSGLVSGFATASLMNVDAIKNIESMGKFIPDVIDTLTAMPGSGLLAAGKRYGKAGMMYLGNMFKTAANEMIQEPTENFLTTWVTDTLKGKGFFTDRDWGEYASELASDAFYAAIGSFGNTMAAMPSWSRSAIYANRMMGKTGLTPAEVTGQLNAFIEDMNDPQVSSQVNANLEAIAVEARTGELLSEGAMPDVDTSAVVAAEKAVQEKAEASAQATAEKDAAYTQFRENPADDAATSRLSAAVKQEQKAVKDAQDAQAELAEAQASVQAQSEAAMEATRAQARAEVDSAINAMAVEKEAEPVPSSYIDSYFDPSEHTQEEIEIANEYKAAVDPTLLEAAKQYRLNGKLSASAVDLGPVSAKERNSVQAQTGIDVTGYTHAVNSNFFAHVERRHGLNGQENQSMSDLNDVARAEWVIKNADSVELVTRSDGTPETTRAFKDKNNKEDQLVRFKKRIDGNVYVVEAVGENNKKRLWLMTAYIQKNGTENNSQNQVSQPVPNGASTPEPYVQAEPSADGIIIPNADENVNANTGVSQFAAQAGQKERQFVKQTMYNAEILPDYVREALSANDKTHFYDVDTNDDQVARGYQRVLENGYEQERDRLLDLDRYAADDAAEAAVLMAMAQHEGDAETLLSLAAKDAQERTQAGKELQSFKILGKMTPTGARAFVAGHTENKLMAELKSRPALKEEADSNAKQIAEKLKNTPVQADGEASADNKWSVPLTAKQAALIDEYGLSKVERPGIHYNRATIKQRMLEAIIATPDPTLPTGGGLSLIQRLEYMQNGLPVVTRADLDYIGTQMEQFVVLGQEEGGRDADLAIARAYEAFGNITPATRMEKFRTQRYVNMLASVPSFLRNIIGNAGQGVVNATAHGIAVEIDRLASIKSGRRTMEHLSFQERVEGWKTFAEETKNTFLDYFVDKVNTAPNREKYSTNQKGRTFQNNVQETVKDVESFMMSVGDRNVWKKAYVNSMAEQQKLAERGLLRNDDGTEVTMEQMVERAEADANYQTYTEDNLVQDVLGYVKGKSSVAADVLSLYVPFTGVPTNIMKRSIQYSPAGLITMAGRMAVNKAKGKKFDQRAFVTDLSRALTGTGGILMGMLLGAGGVIRMGTEDEEGNKAYDVATAKGEQYTPYVYDPITDTYVSMSTFAPFASPLVWGAAIGEALKGDADLFDVLLSAITNSTDSILDASYLSGISDLFGGYGSFTENLAQVTATNLVSQLTPAFLTQIANACDPYVRDTKDKSFITELLKTTASRIPFLRNTVLPKKLDVAGQPTETKGWWSLLDPFSRTKPSDIEALNEVDRLYDLLGDSSVLPSDAARGRTNVLKVNGKRVTLTDEGKEWYKEHYGDLWIEAVNELMSRADYQLSMTDEERAKWISKVLSKAYNTAKEDALEKYGADPEEEE